MHIIKPTLKIIKGKITPAKPKWTIPRAPIVIAPARATAQDSNKSTVVEPDKSRYDASLLVIVERKMLLPVE